MGWLTRHLVVSCLFVVSISGLNVAYWGCAANDLARSNNLASALPTHSMTFYASQPTMLQLETADIDILFVVRCYGTNEINTWVQNGGSVITELAQNSKYPCLPDSLALLDCVGAPYYYDPITGGTFTTAGLATSYSVGLPSYFGAGIGMDFFSSYSYIGPELTPIVYSTTSSTVASFVARAGRGCVYTLGTNFSDTVPNAERSVYLNNVVDSMSRCIGSASVGGDPHVVTFFNERFDIHDSYAGSVMKLFRSERFNMNVKIHEKKMNLIEEIGLEIVEDGQVFVLHGNLDRAGIPSFSLNGQLLSNDSVVPEWMSIHEPNHFEGELGQLEGFQTIQVDIQHFGSISGGHVFKAGFFNLEIFYQQYAQSINHHHPTGHGLLQEVSVQNLNDNLDHFLIEHLLSFQ